MSESTPTWLSEIQDRSWEPELFISGGAIFFLWQATDFLHYESFILTQTTGYFEPLVIANFLIAALNALIFGFALHLITRGFWTAAVTLSYVYPKGVQMDRIHYAPSFKEHIKEVRGTVEQVVFLETVSSMIFTLSFFFFLIIIGLLLTLLVIIPHSALVEIVGARIFFYMQAFAFLLYLLGFIYLIDFFTLGYIKKQKRFAKIYYPIYVVFSWLTLAHLYRTTYYTLVSHSRPWILILGAVLYIAIAFSISLFRLEGSQILLDVRSYLNLKSETYSHQAHYYENLRKPGELVQHVTIQSEIISENYVKLFIVHQKVIENLMSQGCDAMMNQPAAYLRCYSNFYKIYIDGQFQDSLTWRHYKHPDTREVGIVAFIPIGDLESKEHILKIILHVNKSDDLRKLSRFGMQGSTYAYIPFWKN